MGDRMHKPVSIAWSRGALAGAAALLLTSCLGDPYALNVQNVDEAGPQQPAVIQISDPQIYSRETLVNDRRREAAYLEKMVQASETATFEPQLKRDLRTMERMAIAIDAMIAPTAARSAKQDVEAKDLEAQKRLIDLQREITESKAKLVDAEKKLETAGTGDPQNSPQPVADQDARNRITALEKKIEELQAKIAAEPSSYLGNIQGRIDPTKKPEVPDKPEKVGVADIAADPRDVYRDRKAYREELRADQAAMQLDDAHDLGDNALYRLQFQATVMPGEYKGKYAVTRVTVKKPTLSKTEVENLYRLWLGHITFRLNEPVGRWIVPNANYALLGAATGLFFVHEVDLSTRFENKEDRKQCDDPRGEIRTHGWDCKLRLALPAYIGTDRANELLNPKTLQEIFEGHIQALDQMTKSPRQCDRAALAAIASDEKNFRDLAPYIVSALRSLGGRSNMYHAARRAIDKLVYELAQRRQPVYDLIDRAEEACQFTKKFKKSIEEPPVRGAPSLFEKSLFDCNDGKCIPKGDGRAYAVTPTELAQRLSTTAKALNSFEAALAVAASLPTSFLGKLGLSGGYSRSAQGAVEAIERLPRVVGFADRISRPHDNAQAYFGWVFGPRAVINSESKQLELYQTLANYTLTADISVPGWWPRVELQSSSAWIGNWHKKGTVLDEEPAASRTIMVGLPPNRADLDGLSERFARDNPYAGGTLPVTRISGISPDIVAVCENEIELLVYGENVWRSTEAFLNGRKHKELLILPNMAGVWVKFDTRLLPMNKEKHRADLTLWTRNGPASYPIELYFGRPESIGCALGAPPGAAPQPAAPAFRAATTRLLAFKGDIVVAVASGTLPEGRHKIYVEARRKDGAPVGYARVDAKTDASDKRVTGAFDFTAASVPQKDTYQGTQLLESRIAIVKRDGQDPEFFPVQGAIVSYGDAGSEAMKLKSEAADYEFGQDVEIEFPEHFAVAYPVLAKAGVVVATAKDDAGKDVALKAKVVSDWPNQRSRVMKVNLDHPDKDKARAAFLAKARTVTISIKDVKDVGAVTVTTKVKAPPG